MARALVFCLDLFAVASRLKISYDSTTDIVRFYARCRKRYRTRYRTILRKISYDLRRCTAIVRLDIVHIPYRYSTDIVPILRYPHLKLEVPSAQSPLDLPSRLLPPSLFQARQPTVIFPRQCPCVLQWRQGPFNGLCGNQVLICDREHAHLGSFYRVHLPAAQ